MKESIIIFILFIIGVLLGIFGIIPENFQVNTLSEYALYALMFIVGIGIGMDRESMAVIRHIDKRLLLIPFVVIAGTLAFSAIGSIIIKSLSFRETMAIGSGMGYYSLSSILIAKQGNAIAGTTALISNMTRELITLLFTPMFVRLLGPISPIASGGATAMDTTLIVVQRYSGNEYSFLSIYTGVIITILVPFLVSIFI